MFRWVLCVTLCLAGACSAMAEAEKPKTRVHDVEFAMPEGWLRSGDQYGNFIIVPPGLKAGERCEISFGPFDPTPRKPVDHAKSDQDTALAENFNNVKVIDPPKRGRLPSGVATGTVTMTGDSKAAGEPSIKVLFTECDGNGAGGTGDQPVPAQGIIFIASNDALWTKYWPAYESILKTVTFPSHTRLADPREAGGPPLTMYTINTCTDFCEWFMDVPFTQEQRAVMQQYMVDVWRSNDPKDKEDRDGLAEVIKASNEVAKIYETDKRELTRQAVRTEVMKQWREEATRGDRMAKFMVDIYDAANKPIATAAKAGEPNLTRQSADATLEALHFMASKAAGYDVEPTAAQKAEFAQKLAAAYATVPAELKQELAQMPLYWAALRVQWPELPADERRKLAEAWASAEQIKPIVENIKAAKAKADTEAAKPAEQLKALQKYYQERQNVAMISNMMAMQHRTNMTIINNIGSSSYRYEYKYVYRYR